MMRRRTLLPLAPLLPGEAPATQVLAGAFLCAAALALSLPLAAQMHHVDAPERVTRAIGVYEWTGDLAHPTAARLVPVSLFIYGHFEDAGVYLARPVPFALDTGNVYYVEKAGHHEGTLDLDFARNVITRRSATDDNPVAAWYGYGDFMLPAAEPKPKPLHTSANVSPIVGSKDDDDDRPHMARRAPSSTTPTSTTPASTPSPTSSTTPSTPDDPDRPTMSRRSSSTNSGSTTSSSPSTTSSTPTPDDADDPDRPTLRRRDPKQDAARRKAADRASVTPADASLNDDPNRPKMRRGVPTGEGGPPAQLNGLPAQLHQAVAVSDPSNREPHLFDREWETPTERAETLTAFEALARPRIAAYLQTNRLKPVFATAAAPPAKPALHTTRTKPKAASPATPPLTLGSEELLAYTLSYGGLPTFIYTAESPIADGGPVYITLVAQRLPSGELQIALSSLTDATHLDRTPWLRPVDVVDPDAEHRASLLFELRAQNTRQFALYRLTTAEAEQTFITGVIE